MQVAGKVTGLQSQHRTLCGEVEAELARARADCMAAVEAAQLQAEQQAQAQGSAIRRLKAQVKSPCTLALNHAALLPCLTAGALASGLHWRHTHPRVCCASSARSQSIQCSSSEADGTCEGRSLGCDVRI